MYHIDIFDHKYSIDPCNLLSPRIFFKERTGYCYRLCPSVCPSVHPLCYRLLNHWTNSTEFGAWLSWRELGVQRQFFGPAPWGPVEGSKGQISFNFNYKVNFKDFYTKLCVCSHKWKIQNISDGGFILSPGSCPRVGLWALRGQKSKSVLLSVRFAISS